MAVQKSKDPVYNSHFVQPGGVRVDTFDGYTLRKIFLPSGSKTVIGDTQNAKHLVVSCTHGVMAIKDQNNNLIETIHLYPGMVWERPEGDPHTGENVGCECIIIFKA